ncbi:MAG: Uma2 family endonuclease [Eubacterium sp.]|nr:Uma2 family endonuclease [Eubacterium sp.]
MLTIEEMNQIRQNYGISYEEIQKGCEDVSISSIQKIFGGYVDKPRRVTIEKLSRYFETFIKENRRPVYDNGGLASDNRYVAEQSNYFTKGSSVVDITQNKEDGPTGLLGEIFTQRGYTYSDYAKLELPEGVRVEVVDGYLYKMDAPNIVHQDIAGEVFFVIRDYIKRSKGKCKVIMSPVDVRLEYDKGDMTVVQPDLIVVCEQNKIENRKNVKGAPDFVLEVISQSSRKMDMYVKMTKYKENGVREYWLVDYENDKIIKYDFENNDNITMYTFKDKVPVEIYDRKLVIDFKEIKEYVES